MTEKDRHPEKDIHPLTTDRRRVRGLARSGETTLVRREDWAAPAAWRPDPRLKIAADAAAVLLAIAFVGVFVATFLPVNPARLVFPDLSAWAIAFILNGVFPKAWGRPSIIQTHANGIEISDGLGVARAGWEEIEEVQIRGCGATLTTRRGTEIALNLTGHPWICRRQLREIIAGCAGLSLVFSIPGIFWSYRRIEYGV